MILAEGPRHVVPREACPDVALNRRICIVLVGVTWSCNKLQSPTGSITKPKGQALILASVQKLLRRRVYLQAQSAEKSAKIVTGA